MKAIVIRLWKKINCSVMGKAVNL